MAARISRRIPCTLVALGILLPTAAGAAAPTTSSGFIYEDGRIYVPVASAAGPLGDFILDTGSPVTFLDSTLAKRLSLHAQDRRSESGAGRGQIHIMIAQPVVLRVGDTELRVSKPQVGPIDRLLRPYSGRAVPGIVGGEFFRDHIVRIDFRKSRIELQSEAELHRRRGAILFPFDIVEGVPVARGTIKLPDGTTLPLRLLIDLGAKANLLIASPFVGRNHLLQRFARKIEMPLGAGLGGETRYAFVRLPKLSVGTAGLIQGSNLIAGLSVRNTLRGGFYDALLGAPFLSRYRVTFDYASRQVMFEPNGPVRREQFDRSGVFLIAETGSVHRVIVREVLPGSPAAHAGLKRGDVILRIDNRAARDLSLVQVRRLLSSPGKRQVVLELLRNRRTERVRLALNDLL